MTDAALGLVAMGFTAGLASCAIKSLVKWIGKPRRRRAVTTDQQLPPQFATYLRWYLPRKDRDPVLGNLEEEFAIVYKRFGRRKAIIWYYFQVVASFWPYAVRAGKKLVKWGVVGLVGGAIRRFIP